MKAPINPLEAPLSLIEQVLLHRRAGPLKKPTLLEDRDFCQRSFRDLISNSNHGSTGFELCVHLPLANSPACYTGRCATIDRSVRQYLDHLLLEIRSLGTMVDFCRPLHRMHWSGDALHWLNPAELTELMYTVARSFHLQHDHPRSYTAEIDHLPHDDSLLALLCGLGFNEACLGPNLLTPEQDTRAALTLMCKKLFRFGIKSLCCRLPASEWLATSRGDELNFLKDVGVTSLWLQSSHSKADKRVREQLLRKDWKQISDLEYGTSEFQRPDTHATTLGVGLGACTFVDQNFSRNHGGLNQYYSSISEGNLPSAAGGYVKHRAA